MSRLQQPTANVDDADSADADAGVPPAGKSGLWHDEARAFRRWYKNRRNPDIDAFNANHLTAGDKRELAKEMDGETKARGTVDDLGQAYANEVAALLEMALKAEISIPQLQQAWRMLAVETHTAAFKRGLGVADNEMLMQVEEHELNRILAQEFDAIDKAVTEVADGLSRDNQAG